ncbi:MAG: hypothetical protein JRH01_04210 [Deltaproteobacteria bacterium]|nr:hypothetical protein [Deltaproteobacteria bacterium]MBW2395389.1 hypothetical protein [Deltaproteobacteria bacterium]
MDSKFLNARSPMRLLEKGLHGGLGAGNLGLVVAGPGVGKTPFLVGVALDDLLRGQPVLHVALDQTVAHTRAYYDTVFDDYAAHARLNDEAVVHANVDRLRSLRAYPPQGFDAAKLRDAIKRETEAGQTPHVVILEGYDVAGAQAAEIGDLRSLAKEQELEIWISVTCSTEEIPDLPPEVGHGKDRFDVILALEPGSGSVKLRALKDHDNPDVSNLHVALDPKTLLLTRS